MNHCSNVRVQIQQFVRQFVSREQLADAKKIVDACKGIVKIMPGQSSPRLLLVDCDPDMVSGKDIIDTLRGHGITAKLAGM
ncbi:MAG TPA: hypothetical protein VIM41_15800 [Gammaproteobacteria bacterium]